MKCCEYDPTTLANLLLLVHSFHFERLYRKVIYQLSSIPSRANPIKLFTTIIY
jgi:hypothetical protein